MSSLEEIGISHNEVRRLLEELKKDNRLEKYSIEDHKFKVTIKTEFKKEDTEKDGTVEGLYHINEAFLEELRKSRESNQLAEARLQYYRLSGDIRDILQVVGHDMVIAYNELLDHIIAGINRKFSFKDNDGYEGVISTRVFFITGNGGVGKTTLLVMAALYIAQHTDAEVYIAQFKVDKSEDFAKRIIEEVGKHRDAILFIDNPYDNVNAVQTLIRYIRENDNIRIVFSERLNRLELVFKDAALNTITNIAGAIVIKNQEQAGKNDPEADTLRFVRADNTEKFVLLESWKRDVVKRMISYILPAGMELEDDRLQKILEKAAYEASVCEILLQVCLRYNYEVQEEKLETKNPFQFDWDEWREMFSASTEDALKAEGISLENVFPFIAALGLYKIPVTVEFIAKLVGVNELELKYYFDDKLSGTEPVCYDGELLSLKHDVIADLYFQAHGRERAPQYYLMESIKYLDEFLIIEYERYVLSAKIIRGKKEVPHNSIDTIALLKGFEQYESYIQCLISHERFYSYQYARICVITQENCNNEEEFQNVWTTLFQDMPEEERLRLSMWTNCFTTCMEMEFFPPDSFFLAINYIDYRVITNNMSNFENYVRNREYNIRLYRRIARKTYQTIVDRYEEDIPAKLALTEIMMEQSAVKDAENLLKESLEQNIDGKYKLFIEYATLCKQRYIKFDRKIRKIEEKIRERNRINYNYKKVAMEELPDEQNEESVYKTDCLKPINAQMDDKPKKLSYYKQREYYMESAEKYYRLAVELAQGNGDARPLCALANFLQKTAGIGKTDKIKTGRLEEAEKYFSEAIKIGGNDYSAYNGLAMIYAHVQKWNCLFDPIKADRCYEKAMETCPKNMQVSCYVPWGNLNYDIGKLETAKEKYISALACKPDEIKALRAIELIDEEQQKLGQLLKEEGCEIKKFSQLYYYYYYYFIRKRDVSPAAAKGKKKKNMGKPQRRRRLNENLFKEQSTQIEILRLVYASLLSEEITPKRLKECKTAMRNLRRIGGDDIEKGEIGILYLRIAQRLQICCDQNDQESYLDLKTQRTLAHTAFLRHRRATN